VTFEPPGSASGDESEPPSGPPPSGSSWSGPPRSWPDPSWPPPGQGDPAGTGDPYSSQLPASSPRRRSSGFWAPVGVCAGLLAVAVAVASVVAVDDRDSTGTLKSSGVAPITAPPVSTTLAGPAPPTNLLPPYVPAPLNIKASPGSLTPAVEQRVIRTTWTTFATAFATNDLSGMQATSTKEVQRAIAGNFDCGCGAWPTANTAINYSAPAQDSYPLYFMAEMSGRDYDGTPLVKEVAFMQAAPNQPWLVAFIGAYVNSGPIFGTANNQFVTASGDTMSDNVINAGSELADYLDQADQTNTQPPTPQSWYTTDVLTEITQDTLSGHRTHLSDGFQDAYSRRDIDQSAMFVVPGGKVQFATMETAIVVIDPNGRGIVQPQDRSTWGNLLAPGTYHQIVLHLTDQECFGETSTGQITLQTSFGGDYSMTGS